jgi:hypothetical protein
MKEKLAALGSLLASLVLSTCCTLPLALASLGLGSLGLGSVVRPLRPWLIAVSAALLAWGFWTVYTRKRSPRSQALMIFSALVFLVVVVTPYVAGALPSEDEKQPELVAAPGARLVVLAVEDVFCAPDCAGRARSALEALPGVRKVRVYRSRKEAVMLVAEDAEIDDALVGRALDNAGCSGFIKVK